MSPWVPPGGLPISRAAALAAGLLVVVLSFGPDFGAGALPTHDALQSQICFYNFYRCLLVDHDLPLWHPYGAYGTNSITAMGSLTPPGLLVGVVGALLGVGDAAALFKVSVLVEQVVLCIGALQLSSLYYRRPESGLLVAVGLGLTCNWLVSLDGTLRTVYLVPLVLVYLTRFARSGAVYDLWVAGIVSVFACVGNSGYYAPLLALVLALYLSLTLFARPRLSLRDAAPLVVFLASASAFVGFLGFNRSELLGMAPDRDPVTSRVSLDVFLNYGGVTRALPLLREVLTGGHTYGDTLFFVGLAPLVLFALALVRGRGRECCAVVGVAALLVLFSFGGLLARAAYYFPGMSLYRHVGLVFGLVRLFVLLGAGFGLDQLLEALGPSREAHRERSLRIGLAVLAVVEVYASMFRRQPLWGYVLYPSVPSASMLAVNVGWRIVWYGLGYMALVRRRGAQRWWGAGLLAFYAVDVAAFRLDAVLDPPPASAADVFVSRDVFQVRGLPFRAARTEHQTLELSSPGLELFLERRFQMTASYVNNYGPLALDPCVPGYRVDLLPSRIHALFRDHGYAFPPAPDHSVTAPGADLQEVLGCSTAKLRLAPPDLSVPARPLGEVSVTGFGNNFLRAQVDVAGPAPALLYYADSFDPGWRAFVDGVETEIHVANVAFKSIQVPPGSSTVEFRYFNRLGSAAFYALAVGCLAFSVWLAVGVVQWSREAAWGERPGAR